MKTTLISFAVAATICAGAFGTGRALATTTHQSRTKTLQIVMHDPGCHWFKIHGKFTKTASVTSSVRLVNYDVATLKVASRHGMRHIRIGKSIVVDRGNYVIMMAGQAPDDNYLNLTVR